MPRPGSILDGREGFPVVISPKKVFFISFLYIGYTLRNCKIDVLCSEFSQLQSYCCIVDGFVNMERNSFFYKSHDSKDSFKSVIGLLWNTL